MWVVPAKKLLSKTTKTFLCSNIFILHFIIILDVIVKLLFKNHIFFHFDAENFFVPPNRPEFLFKIRQNSCFPAFATIICFLFHYIQDFPKSNCDGMSVKNK